MRAAEAGDSNAMANLGIYYAYGIGVAVDMVESINLYTRAAALGNETALSFIVESL